MAKATPGGRHGDLWPFRLPAILMLALAGGSSATAGEAEPLVLLAQPGPWSAISGLIGYGNRLWFVNSTKFVDHNSADVYSYDPVLGRSRYERHLFSQDAGDPVVAKGLLYWPFADARFSAGRGEYLVTNGREWQWRILPDGQVFHVHAMAASDRTLGALVARLGAPGHPPWLDGDLVGALTALTGRRFGYDLAAWRDWWGRRTPGRRPPAGERLRIPRGVLMMGSDRGTPAERPVHRVTVSAFWIDRFEVTIADFAAFVAATAHVTDPERAGVGWHWEREWREVPGADWRHPHGSGSSIGGLERHPVVQVSWRDAGAYCRWRHARLPTEAEWERAARGNDSRTYPWGDEAPREGARYRASYGSDECCRSDLGDRYLFTAPVGSFPLGQSPFAVQDLAGNVWEWVQDWFDPEFYSRSPAVDPVNSTPAERIVIRGGGWGNDPWGLRSTLRHANPPDIGLSMVGFRCAR